MLDINNSIDIIIDKLIGFLYYVKRINNKNLVEPKDVEEVRDGYRIHSEIVLTEDIIYY
jgi:hypothetical protein